MTALFPNLFYHCVRNQQYDRRKGDQDCDVNEIYKDEPAAALEHVAHLNMRRDAFQDVNVETDGGRNKADFDHAHH